MAGIPPIGGAELLRQNAEENTSHDSCSVKRGARRPTPGSKQPTQDAKWSRTWLVRSVRSAVLAAVLMAAPSVSAVAHVYQGWCYVAGSFFFAAAAAAGAVWLFARREARGRRK